MRRTSARVSRDVTWSFRRTSGRVVTISNFGQDRVGDEQDEPTVAPRVVDARRETLGARERASQEYLRVKNERLWARTARTASEMIVETASSPSVPAR